jgi:hypothetical protein
MGSARPDGQRPSTELEKFGRPYRAEDNPAALFVLRSRVLNHGGDSDSTGSIPGNLLGLIHCVEGILPEWLPQFEVRDVIERVAQDLWSHFGGQEREPCCDQDAKAFWRAEEPREANCAPPRLPGS